MFAGLELTKYGLNARDIKQKTSEIKVPAQIRDEIPTLNRMGYMKKTLDEFSSNFVSFAATSGKLVLEIGCAYGFVVGEVLKAKGRIVANDLSREHLSVLLENTSEHHLENLYLYPGAFPYDLNFPNGTFGAVLASRVMHFLNGTGIEEGLRRINKWLMEKGKFYFTAVSPYHDSVREKFLTTYQERVRNKEKWPGIIEDHWSIAPMHQPYVEQFLNVFDIPQLEELLPHYGFKIDKMNLFTYQGDTASGKIGHIGFEATKISNIE